MVEKALSGNGLGPDLIQKGAEVVYNVMPISALMLCAVRSD